MRLTIEQLDEIGEIIYIYQQQRDNKIQNIPYEALNEYSKNSYRGIVLRVQKAVRRIKKIKNETME